MKLVKLDVGRIVSGLFPIARWGLRYDGGAAVGDLVAGVTVALTLIPQAIAYASLAGLEPQYGLYACIVGGCVYAVVGTCPQINIGPTALLSLLTYTYTHGTPDPAQYAVLLGFVSGLVQTLCGVAQLGFLVELISVPVVSGFTSAAALTIACSQLKGLLGLRFSADTFVGTWQGLYHHIGETRLCDTMLSLVCCVVLMGMKALKDISVKKLKDEATRRRMERALWLVGVARNAVVVVSAALVAYCLHHPTDTDHPLILTGEITAGLPRPSLPFRRATGGADNSTVPVTDMLTALGSGLAVVPLVGIIANVAIAKAFARGVRLDATQEIIALGLCNMAGSFFQAYPVNGSFTRSAVSDASGVRTPAAGFYTSGIVILTLLVLTPYFYFIPRAALAAVIVCAVLHMVDVGIVLQLWRTNKPDLLPLLGTFACCLVLGIELGLACGVLCDVLLLLYYHSTPPLLVEYVNDGSLPPHYAVRPVGGLHFAAAEKVRARIVANKPSEFGDSAPVIQRGNGASGIVINGVTPEAEKSHLLVIYCKDLQRLDYTFLQSMKQAVGQWGPGHVVWVDVPARVKRAVNRALPNVLHCDSALLPAMLYRLSSYASERAPISVSTDTPL